jgi:hypothetical protein
MSFELISLKSNKTQALGAKLPHRSRHKRAKSDTGPYGHYQDKEGLDLPWIGCLFCNYQDKLEFDLSLHMLEEHREELLQLPITRQERRAAKELSGDFFAKFEGAMEYRVDKAAEIAKRKERCE